MTEYKASPIGLVPSQRETHPTEMVDPEPKQDRRPRVLRWLLPTAHATAVPLDGMQEARLKLVAYH